MLNTSSLGDRARDEERKETIQRDNALKRWRTPMQENAARSRVPDSEKTEDLPKVSNGGGLV